MATANGYTNLSQNQLVEAIAVLVYQLTTPFPNGQQFGLVINGANQLQIPDNAYNEAMGQNVIATGDGSFIYLQQMTGEPASGE